MKARSGTIIGTRSRTSTGRENRNLPITFTFPSIEKAVMEDDQINAGTFSFENGVSLPQTMIIVCHSVPCGSQINIRAFSCKNSQSHHLIP